MIIDSIKLSGWRSYDSEGVTLNNLKPINLIIGPNNSGKSNLSKYFNYLKSISDGNITENGLSELKSTTKEGQTWNWEKGEISCEISLSKLNNIESTQKISYPPREHEIDLHCCHSFDGQSAILNYSVNDKKIFDDEGRIFPGLGENIAIDASEDEEGFYDNSVYWTKFIESLVFIDPIRHHARSSDNTHDFYFDGAKIISELDKLQQDDANKSKWVAYKKKIKSWLSDILSEKVTSIEVFSDSFRLQFDSELLFTLDELGTGVSQIVMLLSHLWLNKDDNLNVFLEEPESNLHPDSVINLVNIFEKELTNHKFFITTHSPSLIDCLNDKWSVFTTIKNVDGSSEITPNDNVIKYYETLDALGVKASQILQANTAIWVEGPSDRIYIKRWIEVFSNNKLKEGKDFSFLFFGGTNLASFTALDDIDEAFINMLSTSRKSYLITDSDCSSQKDKDESNYKSTLTSMLERVDRAQHQYKGVNSSLEDYFKIWITDGREIENYICRELLFNVLSSEPFKRKEIGKKENNRKLELACTDSSSFKFDKFDSFDNSISKLYKYQNNEPIDADALKNIASSYAGKKVPIAKEVAKNWSKEHEEIHGLQSQLQDLVDFIKK